MIINDQLGTALNSASVLGHVPSNRIYTSINVPSTQDERSRTANVSAHSTTYRVAVGRRSTNPHTSTMDSEPRPTSPTPEFDVRARIDQFSTLLSRTIICFYQFLASDSESEGPRRRLLDEYITVGGAANSTKILLDTSDERKAEGYLERRKRIESLWVQEGPLAQFASHMENAYNIMSNAIEEHKKVATPTRRRGPFPLSLEMLNEEIRLIQEYKKATANALYDDFYRS